MVSAEFSLSPNLEEPGVWAAEFGVGAATAWPYVTKTVALLAARASRELCQALDQAKEAGHAYLVMSCSGRRQRRTLADRRQLGRMPRPKADGRGSRPTPLRPPPRVGTSQFSHGLTGRYWTMASMPDCGQDADLLRPHESPGRHRFPS